MCRGAVAPLRFVGCHGPFDCLIRYVWDRVPYGGVAAWFVPLPAGLWLLIRWPFRLEWNMNQRPLRLGAPGGRSRRSQLQFVWIWIMEWLMSSILTCLRESPVPSRCANHLISGLFRAIWRSICGYTTTNAYQSPWADPGLVSSGGKSVFSMTYYKVVEIWVGAAAPILKAGSAHASHTRCQAHP
jgi:hypothetical protein